MNQNITYVNSRYDKSYYLNFAYFVSGLLPSMDDFVFVFCQSSFWARVPQSSSSTSKFDANGDRIVEKTEAFIWSKFKLFGLVHFHLHLHL